MQSEWISGKNRALIHKSLWEIQHLAGFLCDLITYFLITFFAGNLHQALFFSFFWMIASSSIWQIFVVFVHMRMYASNYLCNIIWEIENFSTSHNSISYAFHNLQGCPIFCLEPFSFLCPCTTLHKKFLIYFQIDYCDLLFFVNTFELHLILLILHYICIWTLLCETIFFCWQTNLLLSYM